MFMNDEMPTNGQIKNLEYLKDYIRDDIRDDEFNIHSFVNEEKRTRWAIGHAAVADKLKHLYEGGFGYFSYIAFGIDTISKDWNYLFSPQESPGDNTRLAFVERAEAYLKSVKAHKEL